MGRPRTDQPVRPIQLWVRPDLARLAQCRLLGRCSEWLLGAYGRLFGSLDDAIALIGAGTGISPSLGLLDARGPALVRAIAARGLQPRTPHQRPLPSIGELKAWLDFGPLLMDGARWFGEGHWFVGIGYDGGGITIRDSSGRDNGISAGPGSTARPASAAGSSARLRDPHESATAGAQSLP
jgi:hypothetical protein